MSNKKKGNRVEYSIETRSQSKARKESKALKTEVPANVPSLEVPEVPANVPSLEVPEVPANIQSLEEAPEVPVLSSRESCQKQIVVLLDQVNKRSASLDLKASTNPKYSPVAESIRSLCASLRKEKEALFASSDSNFDAQLNKFRKKCAEAIDDAQWAAKLHRDKTGLVMKQILKGIVGLLGILSVIPFGAAVLMSKSRQYCKTFFKPPAPATSEKLAELETNLGKKVNEFLEEEAKKPSLK